MTVVGAKELANALKINTTLTTLNIVSNDIGDDGIKALLGALKVNKTLKFLYIARYNIKNGATINLVEYQKTLPDTNKSDGPKYDFASPSSAGPEYAMASQSPAGPKYDLATDTTGPVYTMASTGNALNKLENEERKAQYAKNAAEKAAETAAKNAKNAKNAAIPNAENTF